MWEVRSRREGFDGRRSGRPAKVPSFSDLEDVVGLLEPLLLENGHADVKDRHASLCLPSEAPVVCVAVEGDIRSALVEGIRDPRGGNVKLYFLTEPGRALMSRVLCALDPEFDVAAELPQTAIEYLRLSLGNQLRDLVRKREG